MPLGLINLYSTRNLGDAAIYATLAQMSPDGVAVGRLVEDVSTQIAGFKTVKTLGAVDARVSVGGDIFNNGRPRLLTRRFLTNLSELNAQPQRTILFGQSIPPSCQGMSLQLLAHAIRRIAAAVVRDETSFQTLRSAKTQVALSYDTAFALQHDPAVELVARNCFVAAGLDPQRTAIISVRNESPLYGDRDGARHLFEIASGLQARGHQIAIIIQADGDDADSDHAMAAKLAEALPGSVILNPFAVETHYDTWEVLTAMLQIANLVVAVRYHAAILRLIGGKSAFVLHYSNKGKDLVDRLRLSGRALGGMCTPDLVAAVEATADRDFNHKPYARDVQSQFNRALRLAGAGAQVKAA